MRRFLFHFLIPLVGFVSVFSTETLGVEYSGRVTTGGYLAQETLAEKMDGSQRNDFATFSSRLFVNASKLDGRHLEFTGDVRDKHDFFDKLDREKLTLTSQNRLQARQLALKYPSPSGFFGNVGRFPIPEAGAAFTDGALAGSSLGDLWSVALFGGLNPKRPDQTYVEFNKDSYVGGAYLLYESKSRSWSRYTYFTQAVVSERVKKETDRTFWYHNLIYQPSVSTRIITLAYLDFVPVLRLQYLLANFYQEWTKTFSTLASATSIDGIEYSRRRGLRERLAPSAFREGALRGSYRLSKTVSSTTAGSYGIRQADQRTRIEGSQGLLLNEWLGKRINTSGSLGYRKNFTSKDFFAKLGVGYYPESWEFLFNAETAFETYDNGTLLYPIVGELSIARTLSRSLYAVASLQEAHDAKATIMSAFIKISYRFGSKEVPPVRDGAPPLQGEL